LVRNNAVADSALFRNRLSVTEVSGTVMKHEGIVTMKRNIELVLLGLCLALSFNVMAILPPGREPLPDLDRRRSLEAKLDAPSADQRKAADKLRERVPNAQIDFDELRGSPKFVTVPSGFLSRPGGGGNAVSPNAASSSSNQPPAALTAFLEEHRSLFGHGPEALTNAVVKQSFVTPHNGMNTMVWEQQVDGIPVFEGVFVAHTTRDGHLINLSSQFLTNPVAAANAGTPGRAALEASPAISAGQALVLATKNIGEELPFEALRQKPGIEPGAELRTRFTAPQLKGDSEARLVWLPINSGSLRLCWDVVLMSVRRGEMFRSVVDAQSGQILVRRCLTENISDVTYRVYTSDSPSPMSPGLPTPGTNQPPLVPRQLLTFSALDTNASPAGWINDGDNETKGNNVDAHLDRNADDSPDLPRPQGNPFRVFDFPLDLTQSPTTYGDAAVVQLFFWCNWMHDQLYNLGFTEAAGNFQTTNFGRGGLGGDALQADAQDGSGTDNANMSTPPDGMAPRMQMYVFTGPKPNRDGDLDAEIVLHEYTHGLSNRRVGGGLGISALQSGGMGEGWSDFYALSLLSEPSDDVDGTYAEGAYCTYLLSGLTENYYFGIRRYPYCTDINKNPLTFKDIDPAQASNHPGIPSNPVIGGAANEVHDMGEVWCVTLWQARAAIIHKHGFTAGNHLILQLVTDGMTLSPPNPNFLQARDAIIQADLVDTGGANRRELWAAFARRGMGFSATSPSSSTTSGLHEAFDVPDDLNIVPEAGFIASGPSAGPFTPAQQTFVLNNVGTNTLNWTAAAGAPWLTIQPSFGSLTVTDATIITVALDLVAASLPDGNYPNTIVFSNLNSGRSQSRDFALRIAQRDYFTEFFNGAGVPRNTSFTFTPDGSASYYSVRQAPAASFPTVPDEAAYIDLVNYSSQTFTLSGFDTVSLYGYATTVLSISQYGVITFGQPDTSGDQSYSNHFSLPRISALVSELYPSSGGSVYCQQSADRVAVTFQGVYDLSAGSTSSFQVEMFFDGRIRLTYLDVGTTTCLIGLSAGSGLPPDFAPSRFSDYSSAQFMLLVTVPATAREGQGQLATQGMVGLPVPLASNLVVHLSSTLPAMVVVPTTVAIPAGATNAPFVLTANGDGLLSGTRRVAISASADGFASNSAVLTLQDLQSASLSLQVPPIVKEGDGVVSGTLTVSAPPPGSVLVNLSSSDTTEIRVPPFAIISAGQTSTVFSVTVVDDHQINGARAATVVASLTNWTSASASITVLDNENTNLVVSLPQMVTEGQGTRRGAGSVSISGTLRTNLAVNLASSASSRIAVPASITIRAGQTSASFDLTLVDDAFIQGLQTVTVTATAAGFTLGSSSLQLWDDEIPPTPALLSPANSASGIAASNTFLAWNGGEGEAAVNGGFESGDMNGWRQTNTGYGGFVIANSSYVPSSPAGASPPYAGNYYAISDPIGPGHIELFQDISIPAGAMAATLSWADRILNFADYFGADQYYRVEIRTTNSVRLQILYTTQPGDPLLSDWTVRTCDLSPYMGSTVRVVFVEEVNPYFMNICLDSISLQLGARPIPTQYAVYFGTNSTLGPANQVGTTTATTWPLPLLAPLTTYYWQIVSHRAGQTASPVWQFTTRGVDHFDWSTVASPQFFEQPFAVSLAAKDQFNRPVPNFTNSVNLSALEDFGSTLLFEDDFEDGDISDWLPGSGTYTRAVDAGTAAVGSRSLTLIGGNQSPLDGLSRTFGDLTPSMVSFYVRGSSSTAAGGYFVIGDGQSTANIVAFFLQQRDGTMGIYEDQGGWHGVPYESNRWYKISLALDWDAHQLDYYVDDTLAIAGIPFRGTDAASINQLYLYNYDNTQSWWDDIRFVNGALPASIALTPSRSFNFANGIWNGTVAILQPAANVHLVAQDGQGHSGAGNSFAVGASNNLSLWMTASTNLAAIGQNLAYTLVVSNSGPQAAKGVYVIDSLPAGSQFISASNSQGTWFSTTDSAVFELGTLSGASAATLGVVVAPTGSGILTNWAAAMGGASEAWMDDNFTEVDTLVMPALVIGDLAVYEGNIGTTNAIFPATLSSPFSRPVQVSYSTSNGNARAGVDYYPSAGTLLFPAGATSNFISVAVIGNTRVESNKQFYLSLSAPMNISLPRSQVTGTILNDDGLAGDLYTLQWDPIASPQDVNRAFDIALTAWDASNHIATNFVGKVALTAISGTRTAAIGTSTSYTESFPMGTSYHDERTQVIYLRDELGGAGRIKSLSLNVGTAPGQAMTNWTIRLKHTQLTGYGYSGSWEADGWTVMIQTNLIVNSTGIITFYFAAPFAYNGVDNLMVDFSFNNTSYSSDGYCYATYQSTYRTFYYQTDSGYGDPLDWSGTSPYGSISSYTPNIQLQFDTTVPIQPTSTGSFTNGVWSGKLTVQGMGPSVTLLADDLNGHGRSSNPFAIVSMNDLGLGARLSSSNAPFGQFVVWNLFLTNSGLNLATGVTLSNALPAGIHLTSAMASQGSLNVTSSNVVLSIPQLSSGQVATLTLLFQPTRCTFFSLFAIAGAAETDDYPDNNSVQTGFAVIPSASINDVSVKEGNIGTTSMAFPVNLSQPSDLPVSLFYSTSDGTAVAGADYMSASGTLSFDPGVTSAVVRVPILGNTRIEPTKTFSLLLSSPSNAVLARSSATGYILNDDGLPGDVFTIAWTPFGSPQYRGRPFATTLTVRDAAGNVATNYNSKAALGAGQGAVHVASIGTASSEDDLPFYGFEPNARAQVLYLTNELGVAGQMTSIALNISYNYYGLAVNNFTIRMKHTGLSSYSSYLWETNDWTTVLRTNLTFSSTGWLVLPLTTPFSYNGASNVMVDFSFSNSSGNFYTLCWCTYRPSTRTLYYGGSTSSGDPLTWSGSSPYVYSSYYTPDLQINFGTPVGCQPALADHFTNGVWSGLVSVSEVGTNIVLSADDRNGHVGFSAPFVVTPIDDVSITVAAPDPVTLGQTLNYTIVVTNTGPSPATGLAVTNVLPPSATFVSASSGAGMFTLIDDVAVFTLDNLAPASSAIFRLVLNPTAAGTITNYATVSRNEVDDYLPNNTAVTVTHVVPTLSIADVSIQEGNAGARTALFPLTLSTAFDQPIQVTFATSNGTATAGSDYVAASGTMVFPPGTTTNAIAVSILGDIVIEPDETFYVNLTAPVNASLARARATGTILNDDGLPGDIYGLRWGAVASPQYVNLPFSATLTALDATSQVASNFNGSVALMASAGLRTNAIGTGASTLNFPLGTLYHDERSQIIFLQSELGNGGAIYGLTLDVATVPGQLLNNWTIRLKHTALSQYGGSPAWEGSGWTIMVQTNMSISSTGLLTFRFASPFVYNGVDNLMVDFSFNNSSYTSDGYCRATLQNATRTIYYRTDSGYGDPLTWSGTSSPYPTTSAYTPNIRVLIEDIVPVQPATTGNFTNGVWSGWLSVGGFRPSVTLLADDLNGHTNVSNPFEVRLANDVAINLSGSPSALTLGQNLTYTMIVTNTGPLPAQGVTVTNLLPSSVTFVSASASQGNYSNSTGRVLFNLGTLSGPGSAVLQVTVAPTILGILTNTAVVARTESDAYLANNTASVTTAVYPTASIAGTSLKEGNLGTTNASFAVTLSGPYSQPVQLSYSTTNGTAKAGIDYLSTTGIVTFAAGTTAQSIAVPVIGNTVIEPDKTFSVAISTFTNAIIATGIATGTVLNDDGLPGDAYTLEWDPIGWAVAGQPFAARLTARDAAHNMATNFGGSALLSARAGTATTNTIGTNAISFYMPMGPYYYRISRTQTIYLTNEIGGAGPIAAIALNVLTPPGRALDNWTVRMKHTGLGSYSSYVWDTNGWTVVLQTNLPAPSAGWLVLPLQTPFAYNGTSNLMVDFSFNTASTDPSSGGYCAASAMSQTRTLYATTESYGDPLNWTGSSPSPNSITYVPNLTLIKGTWLPVAPSITGPFSGGVWSGSVAIGTGGANVTLIADDQNGHVGNSSPFPVIPANDVAVGVSAVPQTPVLSSNFTYNVSVVNTFSNAATGVTLTDRLPPSVTFVSADPPAGVTNNLLSWHQDSLPAGSTTTFSIVVTTPFPGLLTNVATVTCDQPDALPADNVSQLVTPVFGPEVAVFDDPTYVSTTTTNSTSREEQASLTSMGFPVVTFTNIPSAVASHQQLLFPELSRRDLSTDLAPAAQSALSNFVYQGGKIITHGSSTRSASRLLNKVFGWSVQESTYTSASARTSDTVGTAFGSRSDLLRYNSPMTVLLRPSLPLGALNLYTNSVGDSVAMIGAGNGCVVFLGWNWANAAPVGVLDNGWLAMLCSAAAAQPLPPRPPVMLADSALNQINLHWTAMSAATNYTLKRAEASQGPYAVIASLAATNYTDRAVINERPYFYVVAAGNAWGASADSIEVTGTPHNPPQMAVLLSSDASSLTLSWPAWAGSYQLYVTTNLAAQVWLPITDVPQTTNNTLYIDVPVTSEPQKFFRLGP
jgi:uncharacterized repeat protein (TIGR01451 family)